MFWNDTRTLYFRHHETKAKSSPLLTSLWGTFRHLIFLLTHFASMGVLAVGRVLPRGVNEGTWWECRIQYIPRNMHTVFALLCFVVVIHWLIFPYPSGLLHWHCGNLTIAPVPAKQPWWIWINKVYPKKYAHGFCFAVLCCGYTLTDFPISIRLTSLALWQSNDCPSASKATLMNMDK